MKTSTYTTTILRAAKGMYLTEVNPIGESTIATVVALKDGESQEDWKEITVEEGQAILKERQEKADREYQEAMMQSRLEQSKLDRDI